MSTNINPIVDLKSNLKPVQKKILESGLVDKAMIELMEKWGNLPPGSSELVNEDALKEATQPTLMKLAEDLASEVEKEFVLRETYLDLERIRWPAVVNIFKNDALEAVANGLTGVVDRMGRYYFRIQDVKEEWFVLGYMFEKQRAGDKMAAPMLGTILETVIQKQILYIGEDPVCMQVTTQIQKPSES